MVSYLNTSDFFQNTILNDVLSYVVIKVELVCKSPKISMQTNFLFYLSVL